jgi:hydroxymethylbilane synthase
VFVSLKYADLAALPAGAKVGTSSQRRRAQLKERRPDVEAVEFRGNVDTRLRKLSEGQVGAILLAAAGLDRLEKTEWVRQRLDPKDFCPAAGQGSLGIETRLGDSETIAALAFLDDSATRYAVTAERAALAALGGGCQVPIGIHCRPSSEGATEPSECCWEIFGVVANPETGKTVRAYHSVPSTHSDPAALGRSIAEMLLAEGAGSLLSGVTLGAGGAA